MEPIIFSDDEALDYIRALENPNKIGWDKKKRVWRTPSQPGYDKNQIAYGLDIRPENNPIVYQFLKTKGRLNDPWLTDQEAKDLMAQTYAQKQNTIRKAIELAGGNVSQLGYNRLAGMAWHGDPMKKLLDPDSITGKAYREEVAGGNRDLTGTFDTYYGYGSNAKRFEDRVRQDYKYRPQYVLNDQKKMIFPVEKEYKSQWKPEPQIKTIYPVSGKTETPESLSSWNSANAPNGYIKTDFTDLYKPQNYQGVLDRGITVAPRKSPFSPTPPSLSDLMNRQVEQYFADALGISDMFPKFADGKSPIHIKEKNRGKFTALKKRTGHSASWFKAHGTPAQKKMAIFALNARKWKH